VGAGVRGVAVAVGVVAGTLVRAAAVVAVGAGLAAVPPGRQAARREARRTAQKGGASALTVAA
jgi:hypothetical protein